MKMSNINELVSKSNMSNLKILKIKSIPEIHSVLLLKTDQEDSDFFIEILDFDNNKIKQILLDKKISKIRDFHSIDLKYLYLNGSYNGDFDCHLKIDSNNGEIIFHKKFDTEIHSLNYKYILKNYIFREDLVLLNLENFEEYNLYDFISDNFDDEYNFTYLYFSEGRYEIFTLPNNNIIGFEIFDKDGDEPRCTYIILKIENNENIQIKFIGKEEIKIRSGTYKCLKFVPVVQEGRIFKEEEDMTVWITDDKNKILILAEAKVLVGSIKMELVDYRNLANPISIVSN